MMRISVMISDLSTALQSYGVRFRTWLASPEAEELLRRTVSVLKFVGAILIIVILVSAAAFAWLAQELGHVAHDMAQPRKGKKGKKRKKKGNEPVLFKSTVRAFSSGWIAAMRFIRKLMGRWVRALHEPSYNFFRGLFG